MIKHKHQFLSDGGQCTKCGKTVAELLEEKKLAKWVKSMDEPGVPCTKNSYSIESYERITGRGFWGNATSGYVFDKDNK